MEETLFTITECAKECHKSVSSIYKTLKANTNYYEPYTVYKDKTYITAKGLSCLKSEAHKKPQTTTQETAKLLQEIDRLKNSLILVQSELVATQKQLLEEKEYNKKLLEKPVKPVAQPVDNNEEKTTKKKWWEFWK